MSRSRLRALGMLTLQIAFATSAADHYVDLNSANPTAPYTDWSTAATDIQDAIDAAAAGDVIWVTNGMYASGGKGIGTDLTNRVALDKALTVQSVNGPLVTTIRGAGATNGLFAVRCAWLTNGAVLQGFTLEWGATRQATDPRLGSGGAVWGVSSNAVVANSLIRSNTASSTGTGSAAYQVTLRNCLVSANGTRTGSAVGAAFNCVLNNCTVVGNWNQGTYGGWLTNCIVYGNTNGNYFSGTWSYSCSTPLPGGSGNISANPQLFDDGIHLTGASPCRAAGTNITSGMDLFGLPWADPPSMGCAEWQPAPVLSTPLLQLTAEPVGFSISAPVGGQPPFTCFWIRDGVPITDDDHYSSSQTTNLQAAWVRSSDAGDYQLVASNAFGVATSTVARVIIHYVDAAGPAPSPPYLSWGRAATEIQKAIDAALPGEIVLVTNGLYASGGKVMDGDLTNRVTLNKAVLVQSVNGSLATIVQGSWDPTATNGSLAVRCAWLTNGATLAGFTLQKGATRPYNYLPAIDTVGGGVCGASTTNSTVADCVITGNASPRGGGAYRVLLERSVLSGNVAVGTPGTGGGASSCTLNRCVLTGNIASANGGAASQSNLKNCAVLNNRAGQLGGGIDSGNAVNCTITGNSIISTGGGGASSAKLTNCIVVANQHFNCANCTDSNYDASCILSFCCASPLPAGGGNINVDPQLLGDSFHLALTSPCRGAGLLSAVTGSDIDGQPWADPPAIGCDEWSPAPILSGAIQSQILGTPPRLQTGGIVVAGQEPFGYLWFKDGSLVESGPHYSSADTANLTVNGFGPADAGAYQLIVTNAFGSATSAVAQVVVRCVDMASSAAAIPYATWATAAESIQDAIDLCAPGDIVLVTNGVYVTGGRVMAGDLTNRVALNKEVTVISINGPSQTTIQGAFDPVSTNGPLAVRCAWVGDGATLSGFTLQGGATQTVGDTLDLQSGGGAWGSSTNAILMNCVLATNRAGYGGGGCCQGRLIQCRLLGNGSMNGGGAYQSMLVNSLVSGNTAGSYGGGVWGGTTFNCTIFGNDALSAGGGVYVPSTTQVLYRNSIVIANTVRGSPGNLNGPSTAFAYSCTSPQTPGVGNLSTDPELLDGLHLAVTSPCRGAGSAAYVTGTDLEGNAWANPPSMGCCEVYESAARGPLAVSFVTSFSGAVERTPFTLFGRLSGWANRLGWSFGDGSFITNSSPLTVTHTWTNSGNYIVTLTAFNADNPDGVSTNVVIQVDPLASPTISAGGLSGNTFKLSFPAQAGVNYVVERATNLNDPVFWQTVSAFYSFSGDIMQVNDTAATNAMQFYRVRTQ